MRTTALFTRRAWLHAAIALWTFSSMHTGGGHIEAYLVAALPFLWLATQRVRDALFTLPLMLLTKPAFSMSSTKRAARL